MARSEPRIINVFC